MYFDLEGGNRIPKLGERKARSVADLRAAGWCGTRASGARRHPFVQRFVSVGAHDARFQGRTRPCCRRPQEEQSPSVDGILERDRARARTLGREIKVHAATGNFGPELVRLAREGHYELIILALPRERTENGRPWRPETDYVLAHAHCPVFLAAAPLIPAEVAD